MGFDVIYWLGDHRQVTLPCWPPFYLLCLPYLPYRIKGDLQRPQQGVWFMVIINTGLRGIEASCWHVVGVTFNIFHMHNWNESWGGPGVLGSIQGEWQTLQGSALFTNWQESGSVLQAQPAWGSNPGSAISHLGDPGQASTPLCASVSPFIEQG